MRPKIFAHRTGMGMKSAPQNSLRGLIKCSESGADGAECDITFTKDEKPMVWVNNMADLIKLRVPVIDSVSEVDFKRAKNLARNDCDEKILTIEDIWGFLTEYRNIKIFFDVKNSGNGKTRIEHMVDLRGHFADLKPEIINLADREIIQPAIERRLADRIGFVTFWGGAELLRLAKSRDQNIETSLILIMPWGGKCFWNSVNGHFQNLDSIIFGWKGFNQWKWIYPKKIMERIMEKAREKGIAVNGGIADTKEAVRWCLDNKFDGIWTNDPENVRKLIENNE